MDTVPKLEPGREIDIATNRAARKWTRAELIGRAVWEILAAPMFALTPRPLWLWRRLLLRAFGAQIGAQAHICPTVRIQIPWNLCMGDYSAIGDRALIYNLGRIKIGANATISQNAHLCAGSHDFRSPAMALLKLPITIGDGAWICADAFIGPDVAIGDGAVVAARAVVVRDVEANVVVAGNPAVMVNRR